MISGCRRENRVSSGRAHEDPRCQETQIWRKEEEMVNYLPIHVPLPKNERNAYISTTQVASRCWGFFLDIS